MPHIEAADNMRTNIVELVEKLRSSTPSLVAFALANVEWGIRPIPNPSIVVADFVIGTLGEEWIAAVDREAAGRPDLSGPEAQEWLSEQRQLPSNPNAAGSGMLASMFWPSQEPAPPVVCATWVDAHSRLAVQQAHRRVLEVIHLSLLLQPNPEGLGVRGLVRNL